MPRLCSSVLLSLLIASSASAVTMAWTPIGNPGNACDPQLDGCYGAVGYGYGIATYDVTNAQYAEFLNAKAKADPLYLWEGPNEIQRSGNSGSYTYSVIPGTENWPTREVGFYDALRFANWMHNGQGDGATETGSYTLGPTGENGQPFFGSFVTRNPGATIVLPSEDEWYKAAYYDPSSSSYFAYPTGSDTPPICSAPTSAPNHASCGNTSNYSLTPVGSYTGSASPYGTFDQGGNVFQWNEAMVSYPNRGLRGGDYLQGSYALESSYRGYSLPNTGGINVGFRLAMIPEPGTGLLVVAGLTGIAGWRKGRAQRRIPGRGAHAHGGAGAGDACAHGIGAIRAGENSPVDLTGVAAREPS